VKLRNLFGNRIPLLLVILVIQQFIVMHSHDNCATALTTLSKGTVLHYTDRVVRLNHDIELGHKFAITDISSDDFVIKYGQAIGRATQDIALGDWVHIHNIRSVYMEAFTNVR
jgi:hypothetical protein